MMCIKLVYGVYVFPALIFILDESDICRMSLYPILVSGRRQYGGSQYLALPFGLAESMTLSSLQDRRVGSK
jgi:hypothetical protein